MKLDTIKTSTTWAEASGTMNNNNAKITEAIERLESAVEEGGGGGTADSVAWDKVTDKPSWITDSKPVYEKEELSEDVQSSLDKADTALQEIPDNYLTDDEFTERLRRLLEGLSTTLDKKVDKVDGKGLSAEDFTTALKQKLEGLENYDGTQLEKDVEGLKGSIQALLLGVSDEEIDSFADFLVFFDGIKQGATLNGLLEAINRKFDSKQDTISNLGTIESGAAAGATAVQPSQLATVATSGSYNDLSNKPTIPSAVTESTVSRWGFTKNTGTITEIIMNGASKGTSGSVNLGTVLTSHQDVSGKLDITTADSTYLKKTDASRTYVPAEIFVTALKSKQDKTAISDHGTSETTLEITPNVYHRWGIVPSLTITLANPEDATSYNEYMIEFTSGSVGTVLSFPNTVKWTSAPNVEPNKTYQISIVNNIGIIAGA